MAGKIKLIAKRLEDLHNGNPDYRIMASEQRVGRIYKARHAQNTEAWFWGVNALSVDPSIGVPMYGHATTFEDALAKVRETFDTWLVWARAVPKDDLKYREIVTELWKMGERP